jgi:hypothetical protein
VKIASTVGRRPEFAPSAVSRQRTARSADSEGVQGADRWGSALDTGYTAHTFRPRAVRDRRRCPRAPDARQLPCGHASRHQVRCTLQRVQRGPSTDPTVNCGGREEARGTARFHWREMSVARAEAMVHGVLLRQRGRPLMKGQAERRRQEAKGGPRPDCPQPATLGGAAGRSIRCE